jgi:hypothetical protein
MAMTFLCESELIYLVIHVTWSVSQKNRSSASLPTPISLILRFKHLCRSWKVIWIPWTTLFVVKGVGCGFHTMRAQQVIQIQSSNYGVAPYNNDDACVWRFTVSFYSEDEWSKVCGIRMQWISNYYMYFWNTNYKGRRLWSLCPLPMLWHPSLIQMFWGLHEIHGSWDLWPKVS